MQQAIPELKSLTEFSPEDLVFMQSVFDEVCMARNAYADDHMAAIATVAFSTYQAGERSRQRLVDAAQAAALLATARWRFVEPSPTFSTISPLSLKPSLDDDGREGSLRRHDIAHAEDTQQIRYESASTFSTAFSRIVEQPEGCSTRALDLNVDRAAVLRRVSVVLLFG